MKTLYFVTTNKHKFEEVRAMLDPIPVEQMPLDIPELQGEHEHIVKEKIRHACTELKQPCFVEDVALYCDALNGLPGPYIKAFEQKLGPGGTWKLLQNFQNKKCSAISLIGYMEPGGEPRVFAGVVEGELVSPRGEDGWGFDPIFLPEGYEQTYAELGRERKVHISHRGKALQAFKEWLLHEHTSA